ncbi:helix-turn-helix domain-containing protein [Fulvivirga sediminis]|uniref:Helix-turn-helix transcriptional regulator n=1 Tax=Fulvivirga sediminis TaxID=2803949 RepID=A0A937FCZ4_9BACT|nr:AraC family transcriptional regulator [Fulvivirga sediminis]MBL3658504.1 helix-turn-helix transcriptional regulator [Fulvivirga sediminis]
MEETLTFEEFYRKKQGLSPDSSIPKLLPFNIYRLSEVSKDKPMPYSRKDYYKISLISGKNRVHYADKVLEVEDNMLLFANPQIPYNWDPLSEDKHGAFCVFTKDFFNGYAHIKDYPPFKPGGNPILSITNSEMTSLYTIYEKMFKEIASDYKYKYDVLRNLTSELIHTAMKLRPAKFEATHTTESNASERITNFFLELLERQFPIESTQQRIELKSPAEFADKLNVHINHLNKVLKESTGKTTSQIISDRLAMEARAMLKHTHWNISEIGWCLGFDDSSHFIKFFKKNTQTTPNSYRG